jgi:hypothetical protein
MLGMADSQVILYFDDQKAALRFALAAGSVMPGEKQKRNVEVLIQETQRANRIKLGDSFNPASSHPSRETSAVS